MSDDKSRLYYVLNESKPEMSCENQYDSQRIIPLNIYKCNNQSHSKNSLQEQNVDNVSIFIQKKKRYRHLKRNKQEVYKYIAEQSSLCSIKTQKLKCPYRLSSEELYKQQKQDKIINCGINMTNKESIHSYTCNTKDVLNAMSEYSMSENKKVIRNSLFQTSCLKIYRCQLNTQEETCCCSCNSDAMFEVMKSLYDCYKKKNCDHCKCILCGHLPREERRLAERQKYGEGPADIAVDSATKEKKRELRKKSKPAAATMVGKSSEEKEKIKTDLAKTGATLPKPKTTSETKIIKNIKTPFGEKTATQKEKIIKEQVKLGVSLPEERTTSEKVLIAKVKSAVKPSSAVVPTEKLSKVKAAELLTSLDGKTSEQKQKIFRDLAMQGIPLPEGKSVSEKKVINKVRNELGLPPSPKSPLIKEKYDQAMATGFITPLEGKSTQQKEQILKAQANIGLHLPKGRTPSEKVLIKKIKRNAAAERKRVKAQGVVAGSPALTLDQIRVLDKKTAKVIRKGKGPSDECICRLLTPESDRLGKISKILKEPGDITFEKSKRDKDLLTPKTSGRVPSFNFKKAKAADLITSLEGKTLEQKENILKDLALQGIPLPKGKTSSEKKLIDKVINNIGLPPEPKTSSARDKYNKAMAAGIITPLEGKTAAQKEKILRQEAEMGLVLPEGRTTSEKALIAKVKSTVKSSSASSEKLRKAKAAGLLTPIEGKTPEDKEKILKGLVKSGITLPEGKTQSEKAILDRVQRTAEGTKSPSEKIRQAKAAGLLTPLEGKTVEQKRNILKGLVKTGIPLPKAKTPSEKELIQKIRTEVGLPPEPKTSSMKEKYNYAEKSGIITPLEGKTNEQKERILKRIHDIGLPLPEGRTPSEKSIVRIVKAGLVTSSKSKMSPANLRLVKNEDIKTPLEGKISKQKKGKISPEKKNIRSEMGLPLESKSLQGKIGEAQIAGTLKPLEGKSTDQKLKILKSMAMIGVPLPEGRTPSEKALIRQVQDEMGNKLSRPEVSVPPAKTLKKIKKIDKKTAKVMKEGKGPSDDCLCSLLTSDSQTKSFRNITSYLKSPEARGPIPSEKIRAAKEAGLLTPLKGKTPEQKKKIITGLAEGGLPLPEAETASEKVLINKVKTKFGIPLEAETIPNKVVIKKSKAKSLITSKEKTTSEKKAVDKIRKEKPAKLTPSQNRGVVKTKSKKIATTTKSVRELKEEFQDIIKTTKCDRGCGCDKKKIRFKHSYVKIRVTSPDISSVCPCPDECLPGVKNGMFIDNEGIKVTVGRAIGLPSYTTVSNKFEYQENTVGKRYSLKYIFINEYANEFVNSVYDIDHSKSSSIRDNSKSKYTYKNSMYSKTNIEEKSFEENIETSEEHMLYSHLYDVDTNQLNRIVLENYNYEIDTYPNNSTSFCAKNFISSTCSLKSNDKLYLSFTQSNISLESIYIIQSELSISSSNNSYITNVVGSISITSFTNSYCSSYGNLHLLSQHTKDHSNDIIEKSEYYLNETDCNTECECNNFMKYQQDNVKDLDKDNLILQKSNKEHFNEQADTISAYIINDFNNSQDFKNVFEDILTNSLSHKSSIFIIVSSSDTHNKDTTCIQMSKKSSECSNILISHEREARKSITCTQGLEMLATSRNNILDNLPSQVDDDKLMRHLQRYGIMANSR